MYNYYIHVYNNTGHDDCADDSRFVCGDGVCISVANKCDGYLNCYDGSDEAFCRGMRMLHCMSIIHGLYIEYSGTSLIWTP